MKAAEQMTDVELLLLRRGADLTLSFADRLGDETHKAPDLVSFKEAGASSAYFHVVVAANDIINFTQNQGATRASFCRLSEELRHALGRAPHVSRSMLESLKIRDAYALDVLRRWSA